ncbi:MAG TPA: hypothetical protein VF463_18300 [Sphingobium sp.]
MADLYQKALESERKSLWAFCRLRGLAKDTPERQRIAQIDAALKEHADKKGPVKVAGENVAKTAQVKKAPVKKAGKPAPRDSAKDS